MNLTVNYAGSGELSPYVKMLVAGASGVGKTRFALTAPNPIFANCYSGLATLAVHSAVEQVPFVNITEEQDLLNLKFALDADRDEVARRFGRPIDTLVVDTVDAIQRLLIVEKMQKDRKDEFGPSDWGWLGQRCNAIFENICALNMNVILLLHTKTDSDGDNFWIKPGLQGAFVDQINQYVDYGLLLKANCSEMNLDFNPADISISGNMVTNEFSVKRTSGVFNDDRYLVSRPTDEVEWLHDYTNTLPPKLSLNFEDDFQRILDYRESLGELPESMQETVEIEGEVPSLSREPHKVSVKKRPPEKKIEPVQVQQNTQNTQTQEATDTDCSDCGKKIETQDWVDISTRRYDAALCRGCFVNRRG